MKKITASLLGLMMSFIIIDGAIAQSSVSGANILKLIAAEPPLNQNDIDLAISVMPSVGNLLLNPKAMQEVYQKAGISEARGTMILSKISYGLALASGVTPEKVGLEKIPEILRPTEADVVLIKKNLEPLNQAMIAMQKSMAAQK